MEKTPLKILNLKKCFGSVCAVNDLSFSIEKGEIFGLLGPNGAGKTTTISCITTLESPTSGSIEVFGYNNVNDPYKAKHLMGCVPQELVHHDFFSVSQILHFHSLYYGLKHFSAYNEFLMHKLDLFNHRKKKVNELSGGMKRRLLIAKALVHKPQLLLLDEPTAGVDVELRSQLWDLIRDLKEEGVSILLTTHYLEEAQALCDRIGIIQNGTLVKNTLKEELLKDMGLRTVTIFLKGALEPIKHQFLHQQSDQSLVFHTPQTFTIAQLLDDLKLCHTAFTDISIQEGTLEDIFTKIVQTGNNI